MKPDTYGSNDAAKILVELIQDDHRLKHKVGSVWMQMVNTMTAVEKATTEDRLKLYLMKLIRDDTKAKIAARQFPLKVSTYLTNCVVGRYRDGVTKVGDMQRTAGRSSQHMNFVHAADTYA